MKFRLAGAALGLALLSLPVMAQDVEVRMLHIGDTPSSNAIMADIAAAYEAAHPGVRIVLEPIENEALRTKLATLMQSDDAPDIVGSFGGGDIEAQDDAGYLADISGSVDKLLAVVPPAAVNAFNVHGHQVGVATDFSLVNLYVNKSLIDQAGVTLEDLASWEGFLASVAKLKAAGITPIVTSGGDKWPVQHWLLYLMLREGGGDIMNKVRSEGFATPEFLAAAAELVRLGATEPFQDGWLNTNWLTSIGQFGDGKGAIYLAGNWAIVQQADNAADGKGISRDNLLTIPFPGQVPGGKGDDTETVGGLSGWTVTQGAPDEAVDFLAFFAAVDQQKAFAEAGLSIPAALGVDAYITDPTLQWVVQTIAGASKHQNFADRDLGPSAGGAFNDVAVALAAGVMTPEEAAATLQDAWDNR